MEKLDHHQYGDLKIIKNNFITITLLGLTLLIFGFVLIGLAVELTKNPLDAKLMKATSEYWIFYISLASSIFIINFVLSLVNIIWTLIKIDNYDRKSKLLILSTFSIVLFLISGLIAINIINEIMSNKSSDYDNMTFIESIDKDKLDSWNSFFNQGSQDIKNNDDRLSFIDTTELKTIKPEYFEMTRSQIEELLLKEPHRIKDFFKEISGGYIKAIDNNEYNLKIEEFNYKNAIIIKLNFIITDKNGINERSSLEFSPIYWGFRKNNK